MEAAEAAAEKEDANVPTSLADAEPTTDASREPDEETTTTDAGVTTRPIISLPRSRSADGEVVHFNSQESDDEGAAEAAEAPAAAPPPHYGTKPGHLETSKIHFPTSE